MIGTLVCPIPNTTRANDGAYAGDTGLDIHVPQGTPCYVASPGTVLYAERGHTAWPLSDGEKPFSVLIELDTPVILGLVRYYFIWYTHMINTALKEGQKVKVGDLVGHTGWANNCYHLHFGLVQDRAQTVTADPFKLAEVFWGKA